MKWVWREYKNERRGNQESVKSASGRESRWAERTRLTCKTHFRIKAAYCAKLDSLSQAEGGEGHKCAHPEIHTGEKEEANILKWRISGMSLPHCWPSNLIDLTGKLILMSCFIHKREA